MKKLYTTMLLLLLIYTTTFSQSFDYSFTMPKIDHARDLGMGSAYLTDTTTYFAFLTNPANLGLTGDKTLFPIINTRLAGPFGLIPEAIDLFQAGDADIMGFVGKTLGESKGINMAFNTAGPLSFGAIRKGFGWGIFNESYASFDMPSLLSATVYGGNESFLRLGYGYAITPPLPVIIAVGLSAEAVNRVEGFYRLGAFQLLNTLTGGEISLASLAMPVYTSFGYGLDAGITIKAFNLVSLSFVWDDFFYGIHTQKADQAYKIIEDPSNFTSHLKTDLKQTTIGSSKKMAAGIGVDIPLAEISNNFVSSWIVMVDCNDLISTFSNDPTKRNPALEFSAGTEIVFFKTIILRFGVDEMYPAAGIGIRLGAFNIDASIYGQELGYEPGARPQLNTAFSIGFYK